MPLTSVWEEVGSLGRGKVPTSERTEYKIRVLGGCASNKKSGFEAAFYLYISTSTSHSYQVLDIFPPVDNNCFRCHIVAHVVFFISGGVDNEPDRQPDCSTGAESED